MDALRHGMQFINQGGFVETKSGAVHHFQDVAAAERRRIELPETIKVGQRPALAIFQHDGFAQRRLANRRAKSGLNHLLQAQDLRFPQCARGGIAGAVRQLHDVDRLELGHVLIHFLFAVAGGFPNHQVREIEVGTFIGFAEAVAAFDKRAEVAREIFSASSMVSSEVEHSETTTAPAAMAISWA